MKLKKRDLSAGLFPSIATAPHVAAFSGNKAVFGRAFARGQKRLSRYRRPLFVVPAVSGAYRKPQFVPFASLFALFARIFRFPQPVTADERATGFSNFGKEFLTTG